MWQVFCWTWPGAFLGCMFGIYFGSWRRGTKEAKRLVKRAADLRGDSDRALEGLMPDRFQHSQLLLARAFECERWALLLSGEKGAKA